MAIIYSYPVASAVEAGDLVIGTDITGKQTKNFTLQSIADLAGNPDLQSVLTSGNRYISPDGFGVFILNDLANNNGDIKYTNSDEDWGYRINGEDGLVLTDGMASSTGRSRIAPASIFVGTGGSYVGEINAVISADRTYQLPNASGIFALKDIDNNFSTDQTFEEKLFIDSNGDYIGTKNNELYLYGDIGVKIETTDNASIRLTDAIDIVGQGVRLKNSPSSYQLGFRYDDITANRFVIFPDASGTIALTSDIIGQGLQSVLDTGREWTSSNGFYKFSLLEGSADLGQIYYENTDEQLGYYLNADEGLIFNNAGGGNRSVYGGNNGFSIKGSNIQAEYKDTRSDGNVYIQETFGNAFTVANRTIWDNPGGQGIQTTFSSNEPGGTLHWQYQNDFAWSVNDNEEILRIRGDINGSGRVGIKTSNPQRELDVNGGVRVRGPLDLFQQNDNTFAGTNAGNYYNVVGNSNAAFGEDALATITTASRNTAVGFKALNENTIGNNNTGVGNGALEKVTVGSLNTAVGDRALQLVVDGQGNTAIGQEALLNQTTGNFNVSVGRRSGENITTGFKNTFLGYNAGVGIITGQRNIYIGSEATTGQDTTNTIVIGASQSELGSNTTVIGNSDITETLIHGNISFEQHGGTNVRALIGTTTTSPNCDIEIGQTGTSIIEGINLKPGDAGGIVDIYNNTSVAARFKSAKLVIGDLLDVSKTMDKALDIQDNDPFIRLENSLAKKLDFWVDPSSSTSYIATSGGNDTLNLSTGGSDRIHIANDGSIGIGTTNPGSILEIVEPTNKAELKLKVLSDEDTAVSFENPNRIFKVGYDTSKDVFKVAVSSFNSKNFTIAPGGNCGIGTDEPDRDLHIASSTAAIELENTSQSDCFINFKNPGRTFKVGYDDSSDVWKVAKSTFGNNALTVNGDDGRVGLGTQTTDPSAILELDSDEQGFLMPRLTTTEINAISSPATGLAVYNTSINTICFYNGTSWQKISHANM